jgi:crotonobetainyl-CoA:carnitine CoA-transferase CaiB-like acyl-CoA transferase
MIVNIERVVVVRWQDGFIVGVTRHGDGVVTILRMSNAPLAGIRVVEVTSIYSGPMAGMMLAELGAEVIKLESPNKPDMIRNAFFGPHGLSPQFYALNRGKKFVSVDAGTPEGRDVVQQLVASADVFLHNIRPEKPEAIGLGYDELSAANPRLIYVAISGYGNEGPLAAQPAYDYAVQARVGMVDYQRDISTGKASLVSQVLVDKTSAQAAVQGVLAALYVRERSGVGQRIDIPMIGVGLHFEWPDTMSIHFSQVVPTMPHEGMPPHLFQVPAAALLVLTTSDEGEIACSPAMPPFDGFAIALDRPDWIVDERFAENMSRMINLPALLAEITEAAAAFTRADLLARFAENGVACGPVNRRSEVLDDAQIRHLGLISEADAPMLGTVRQPAPMWHFSASPTAHTTHIAVTGGDTREVLLSLGIADSHVADLLTRGIGFEGPAPAP